MNSGSTLQAVQTPSPVEKKHSPGHRGVFGECFFADGEGVRTVYAFVVFFLFLFELPSICIPDSVTYLLLICIFFNMMIENVGNNYKITLE